MKQDNTTLKDNNCDLIALTRYDGDEPIDYTKSDKELEDWLNQNPNHSWFPIVLDED